MTDTTPGPERIWINPDHWIERPPKPTDFRPEEYVQYIREDISDAAIAELVGALRAIIPEAINDRYVTQSAAVDDARAMIAKYGDKAND